MNILWLRFLKVAYHKEPISGFILIAGAVDAAIGGVSDHPTLLAFGIAVALGALLLRWWQLQRVPPGSKTEVPKRFLPSASSRSPLPLLTNERRRPPH